MPKKILIVAANPRDTDQLRLDEEVREIDSGLRRARKRTQFKLEQKWAVRPLDLRRALLDYEPEIVHFAGHGAGHDGIQLEDQNGNATTVQAETLAELFSLFPKIECVFLNACYTDVQAKAIGEHIDYVIGMSHEVGDQTAIEFAVGFYDAIGAGKAYDFAYKFALTAIKMTGNDEGSNPVFLSRSQRLGLIKTYQSEPPYIVDEEGMRPRLTRKIEQQSGFSSTPNINSQLPSDEQILQDLLSNDFHYIRRGFDFIDKTTRVKAFQKRLLELFNNPTASYQQRIAIGKAFSVIGDPRDLNEMVLIPKGNFWLGSDKQYIQSMIDKRFRYYDMTETPQQKYFVKSYQIAKYPVTNRQYYEFIQAMPGHLPPPYWADKKFPDELANHPVTQVSWNDAVAYARWYGGRLPTEFEWEKAARGANKWLYPWGDDFDPERCNVQLQLNGIDTTSVGVFTTGASSYGVLDLAGNVWEWTSSQHKPYPNYQGNYDEFDEHRFVARGGSYYNVSTAARCSYRFPLDPNEVSKNVGFRIAMDVVDEDTDLLGTTTKWFSNVKKFFLGNA